VIAGLLMLAVLVAANIYTIGALLGRWTFFGFHIEFRP